LPAACDVYRVEVGGAHRIIYQIKDESTSILVVKVADRKDVYKRLSDLRRLLE
jgi:mRNA-degrading endonuclease RelE of RelBE toxin-antitoxin system